VNDSQKLTHLLTSLEVGSLPYWQNKYTDSLAERVEENVKYAQRITTLESQLKECVSLLQETDTPDDVHNSWYTRRDTLLAKIKEESK
jgi:hypothetical protein